MLFSAIILSSTTVIIGCLVVLITESLYNLLYNLPSAPPEMGGLLGQSKNTINTIFVDSGKISFRKSCQYVPNELLLNQTISDWDAQGIIFKGIFHTHKEGHGCQCLSSADIVYIRSIMNAYAQRLEEAFYSSKTPDPVEDTEPKTADTAVTESDESDAAKILELLKNPETAALLKQLAKAL